MDILSLPAGRLAGRELLSTEKVATYVVGAAVWAPSVHNTQPWWFTADRPQISLHADASRQLMVADPGGREMMISCGAALFTARLALRSLGYIPEACVLPDPGQPFELAWLRASVRTWLRDGSYPQLLLRLGTVIQTAVSVRRPPASVLFPSGGAHLGSSHG